MFSFPSKISNFQQIYVLPLLLNKNISFTLKMGQIPPSYPFTFLSACHYLFRLSLKYFFQL